MIELGDGTRVVIRAIRPEDKEALLRGFEQLSEHSRYRRFFTDKSRLSPAELRYLTEVDQKDHVALVAATEDESRGLGVARFFRDGKAPTMAEAAVVVVDDMHRKGLGTLLLAELAREARARGITAFGAEILEENEGMRRLLTSLNPQIAYERGPGGTVRAVIPIPLPDELPSSAMALFMRRVADGAISLRRQLLKGA